MTNYSFQYDLLHNLEKPDLYLAEPTQIKIGILDRNKIKNLRTKMCFNNVGEASFDYVSDIGDKESKYFDKLMVMRTILIIGVGWYQITTIDPQLKGTSKSIKVTMKSLEYELIFKSIEIGSNLENDVDLYYLYNVLDTEHSLLHRVIQLNPSWNIGYVSNSISQLAHQFNISSTNCLSLLMNEVSKSFNCIFQFDTFQKTISAYTLSEFMHHSGIYLSFNNLMNESSFKYDITKIVTKLKVLGGNDVVTGQNLMINDVNPSGNTYIYNFNSIMYMLPQDLQNKLITYQIAFDANKTLYTSALIIYTRLFEELQNLQTSGVNTGEYSGFGLDELEIELVAKEALRKSYLTSRDTNNYNSISTIITTIENEIATRKSQIASKQDEIDAQFIVIQSYQTNINDYITSKDNEYLSRVTLYSDFQDSSFVTYEGMTTTEQFEIEKELLKVASEFLAENSKPSYTLSVNSRNFINIFGYENFTNNLKLGDLLTIDFDEKLSGKNNVTSRLLSIEIDWDNLDNFTLEFSSKNSLDGKFVLNEILEQSNASSNYISYNNSIIRHTTNKTNSVTEFMNSTLNATHNKLMDTDNQEFVVDHTGFHLREYNNESQTYNDNQIWGTSNGIYMSKTGFRTAPDICIGELVINGTTEYGIIAPMLIGKAIIGNTMWFENDSGKLTFNDDGFKVTNDTSGNTVWINPKDVNNQIFQILKGEEKVIYLDSNGDANFKGKISASSFLGGSIEITNSTNTFKIDSNDVQILQIFKGTEKILYLDINGDAHFKGEISASSFMGGSIEITNGVNTFKVDSNDTQLFQILKGASKVIYFNNDGDAVFNGTISGSHMIGGDANFGNGTTVITSNGKISTSDLEITGGSINLGNGIFIVNNTGEVSCSNLTVTGGNISGTNFNSISNDNILNMNLNSGQLTFSKSDGTTGYISGTAIETQNGSQYSSMTYTGFGTTGGVSCSTINCSGSAYLQNGFTINTKVYGTTYFDDIENTISQLERDIASLSSRIPTNYATQSDIDNAINNHVSSCHSGQ